MIVPEISGTVKLSSIRRGRSSVNVAKNAPVIPTIGLIKGNVITPQTMKQAALPSKLLFPISFVRPHLFPTRAAAVSPKIMNKIHVMATNLSKITIHRKTPIK